MSVCLFRLLTEGLTPPKACPPKTQKKGVSPKFTKGGKLSLSPQPSQNRPALLTDISFFLSFFKLKGPFTLFFF